MILKRRSTGIEIITKENSVPKEQDISMGKTEKNYFNDKIFYPTVSQTSISTLSLANCLSPFLSIF